MSVRRLLAALAATLVALSLCGAVAPPVSAAAGDPAAELALLDLLNGERTSRGVPALRTATDLVDVARHHAARMAESGLQHNPRLAEQVRGWTVLSENVGYGGSPQVLHSALMGSPGHRGNILDGRPTQVGVGAVRDGRGTLWVTQVFRAPDGSAEGTTEDSSGGRPPAPAGPVAAPELAVAAAGSSLYAVERGPDGSAGLRTITDAGFSGSTTPLGGAALDAPAVETGPDGTVSVVVRGTDRAVWLRTRSRDGWQPWVSLGGAGTSRPAVTSRGAGRLDVVVRGADGGLWHRAQQRPGSWTDWTPLGGALADGADPAAVASGQDRLTVAVQGRDEQAWARSWDGRSWAEWTPLGGHSRGGPALASPADGRVVVTLRGLDEAGWARELSSSTWTRLGGVLATPPSAQGDSGRTEVVTVGTDGRVYRASQVGADWSDWRLVG